MEQLKEFFGMFSTMPFGALVAAVVLAAFALAGYAIYAVVTVATKGQRQ